MIKPKNQIFEDWANRQISTKVALNRCIDEIKLVKKMADFDLKYRFKTPERVKRYLTDIKHSIRILYSYRHQTATEETKHRYQYLNIKFI